MTAADIQSKLDKISAQIDTILESGESYTLNDGQGVMTVKRPDLIKLERHYDYWSNRLAELNGEGSFVSLRSVR